VHCWFSSYIENIDRRVDYLLYILLLNIDRRVDYLLYILLLNIDRRVDYLLYILLLNDLQRICCDFFLSKIRFFVHRISGN
jgi:hypothetical protein